MSKRSETCPAGASCPASSRFISLALGSPSKRRSTRDRADALAQFTH